MGKARWSDLNSMADVRGFERNIQIANGDTGGQEALSHLCLLCAWLQRKFADILLASQQSFGFLLVESRVRENTYEPFHITGYDVQKIDLYSVLSYDH